MDRRATLRMPRNPGRRAEPPRRPPGTLGRSARRPPGGDREAPRRDVPRGQGHGAEIVDGLQAGLVDVVAPDPLDVVGVATHDRLHDALVLPVAEPAKVRLAQHARAEVADAPVPQPIGHADQEPIAGLVNDDAVELRVRLVPCLGIVPGRGALHRAEKLSQTPDVRGPQVRHGQAGSQAFQAAPHLGDLAHRVR